MKVLITSPSLDENENVSGISTMIKSIIKHAGCEFVHFQAGRKDNEKSGLNWFGRQLLLPYKFRSAVSEAKADLIHINTAFEPRAIARDLALLKFGGKQRTIVHVHGGRFVLEDPPTAALTKATDGLLRSAAHVIVLSDAEAENILQRTPGINVSVLPNAVATREFPAADRPWQAMKTVTYLGRLAEPKGLSEIVETCRLLTAQGFSFKFACYGTGPDQEEFIRRMTNVLGENFYYGGVVRGREKIHALHAADIFLMPSRFEGLSLALLEAMAAGCVPIVSERGAMPTVVKDGRNGFLVDPGDITQIVGKLKFLLSEGETGWEEYRKNARETVRERFDIEDYVRKLRKIYTEVLAAK